MSRKTFDMRKYLKENKITLGKSVNEAKYDTEKKKINFLKKKGNIVSFEKPVYGKRQVIIDKLETSRKSDKVRLHGEWGFTSPWYDSIDDLIDVVDWDWMEKNH